MGKQIIRKEWPRVSSKQTKSGSGWNIDARRKGTNGREEFRADRTEALARAAEIAEEYAENGRQGLALSGDLRYMALTGERMLEPYGKTVLQACEHYRDFLAELQRQQSGETIAKLAEEWYDYKKTGKQETLRKATIDNIRTGKLNLTKAFGARPITSITQSDARHYLDNLSVATQTKANLRNLFGQFFNWCIAHKKGITINPAPKEIKYGTTPRDVVIWTPQEAQQAMTLCESKYPPLTLFHAVSLFAGLRPDECRLLTWENINLEKRTIIVRSHTSKVKASREVPIEDNLLCWLELVPAKERNGLLVRKQNFTNIAREFRAELGYCYQTVRRGKPLNPNGERGEYVPDTTRHSYGTYFMSKYKNRALLAENMGNSVDVIRKHYLDATVGHAASVAYWSILPKASAEARKRKQDEDAPLLEQMETPSVSGDFEN